MFCCGGKKQQKKESQPLKNQVQQPIRLNLSPNISLTFKQTIWSNNIKGKINKIQQNISQSTNKNVSINKKNEKILKEKKKKEAEVKQKQQILNNLKNQQTELRDNLDKNKAIQKVLQYLVLKQVQKIDSYALKIQV